MEIQVIKRDGSTQPYDQHKIARVTTAAGLNPQQADELAQKVTALIQTLGSKTVESATIRGLVLEELQKINQFAAQAFDWYEKDKDNR